MNESMINSSLLRKAIVGLKQSSRACFDKFSKVVSAYGLKQTEVEHSSVFVCHTQSGSIILAVYVDDIVIIGSNRTGIVDLKQYLSKHFYTKDLGKLRYFLGI